MVVVGAFLIMALVPMVVPRRRWDGRHPADRNAAAIHANSNSSKEAVMIIIANVSQEEEELCLGRMGIKDMLQVVGAVQRLNKAEETNSQRRLTVGHIRHQHQWTTFPTVTCKES